MPRHSSEMSLWTARMFKPVDTPIESFKVTLDLVNGVQGDDTDAPLCSMGDVLKDFDRKAFLRMRNELRAEIASSKV